MKRREFIKGITGSIAAWPLAVQAQRASIPMIAFVSGRSADASVSVAAAFRKGLNETGYVEGQNVMVEYHWLEGQYDRLPAMVADLVRRRVAVIAVPAARPLYSRPKLRPRRSRSSSVSPKTRSGLVLSPTLPGLAAMRRASIFLWAKWKPSDCGSCTTWCPRPFALPYSLTQPMFPTPRLRCTSCRKPPTLLGYKSRSLTPRRSARLMRPLPALRANAPMPSSSLRTPF